MMIFQNDLYVIKLKFMHDIKLLNYFWAMIYTFVHKQMPKLLTFTAEGCLFKKLFQRTNIKQSVKTLFWYNCIDGPNSILHWIQ
jgi:hypothetical protein